MMAITKHRRQLLVIIAEATLEKALVRDVKRLGAHGYTVYDVRGEGSTGVREGAWEADRTIEMKVICEEAIADAIAEHVLAQYAPNYGVTMFFTDVQVLRPQKF
ncbi:P-II family nitrogen regulator [Caldimonas brevitalea]|uniref:Nitrogen regulatory protein P-II n=1 Tax=Caldimonas brevitalea TaxID=413882 RepID=A0A0G3BJ33_9BURK|nr:transcriptional regulator [Caldimonas brevitalea]AKJ27371.1 nitrogen regulatory protein P-II [Caldimonas brevitalea]